MSQSKERNRRELRYKQERKKRIYERDQGKCQIGFCGGVDLTIEEATLDHIIPFSHGGPTVMTNLQLACRPCNEKKANIYECECGLPPTAQGCRKGINRAWERYADDLEWRMLYREWKNGEVPMLKAHWDLPLDKLDEFFREQKRLGRRP